MCRFKDPFSWMAGSLGDVSAVDPRQDWACLSIQLDSIQSLLSAVSNLFDTRDRFHGRQFWHGQWGEGNGGW